MPGSLSKERTSLGSSPARMFLLNDRMNQSVIEHLDPTVWRAKPPGRVRAIAAVFTHMHNVRTKWIRLTAPHLQTPALLRSAYCTPDQAAAALKESAARCAEMLDQAFAGVTPRIEAFRRDGWAPAWPVGPEMLCYMFVHEAHHRGQVCMLAHQLGFPLPLNVSASLWNWEKLLKPIPATP